MEQNKTDKLYELINNIPVTEDNMELIKEIKGDLASRDYASALKKIERLGQTKANESSEKETTDSEDEEDMTGMFPKELSNTELERQYIGLLLTDPRFIIKYYYLHQDCYFESPEMLNIYKSVLFTEGGTYTSEIAKKDFNFSKDSEEVYALKNELKKEVKNKNYNMEKIYIELKKLFVLRKNYLAIPIKNIQEKVIEIKEYQLYDRMSVEEVESAVIQVNDTEKFKRAILNENLTSFFLHWMAWQTPWFLLF